MWRHLRGGVSHQVRSASGWEPSSAVLQSHVPPSPSVLHLEAGGSRCNLWEPIMSRERPQALETVYGFEHLLGKRLGRQRP